MNIAVLQERPSHMDRYFHDGLKRLKNTFEESLNWIIVTSREDWGGARRRMPRRDIFLVYSMSTDTYKACTTLVGTNPINRKYARK